MEPLDLSKIDAFAREQTDREFQDNNARLFCRRYYLFYRMTRFGLGILSWIPAAAVLGILYLISQELGVGGLLSSSDDDEYLTAGIIALALLVMHPIGAFSLLVSNLWTESLLPNRSNLVVPLISGACCCFSDGVLSCKQALVLCLTQILSTTSVYVCFVGSFILFTPYYMNTTNGKDKVAVHTSDTGASFVDIAVFLCCGIPVVLWYGLFRYCYHRRCWNRSSSSSTGSGAYAYNRAAAGREEILTDGDGPMTIEIV